MPELRKYKVPELRKYKVPVVKPTPFTAIRNKYGQEFLNEYNIWSIKDAKDELYFSRMFYFDMNGEEFKRYLKIKEPQLEFDF